MNKAESLRQAELNLLKSGDYSDPFYWAGFVVTGDVGTVATVEGLKAGSRMPN